MKITRKQLRRLVEADDLGDEVTSHHHTTRTVLKNIYNMLSSEIKASTKEVKSSNEELKALIDSLLSKEESKEKEPSASKQKSRKVRKGNVNESMDNRIKLSSSQLRQLIRETIHEGFFDRFSSSGMGKKKIVDLLKSMLDQFKESIFNISHEWSMAQRASIEQDELESYDNVSLIAAIGEDIGSVSSTRQNLEKLNFIIHDAVGEDSRRWAAGGLSIGAIGDDAKYAASENYVLLSLNPETELAGKKQANIFNFNHMKELFRDTLLTYGKKLGVDSNITLNVIRSSGLEGNLINDIIEKRMDEVSELLYGLYVESDRAKNDLNFERKRRDRKEKEDAKAAEEKEQQQRYERSAEKARAREREREEALLNSPENVRRREAQKSMELSHLSGGPDRRYVPDEYDPLADGD